MHEIVLCNATCNDDVLVHQSEHSHTHTVTHIHTGINIFSQSQLIAAIAIIKGNLNLQIAIWGQTLHCDTSMLPDILTLVHGWIKEHWWRCSGFSLLDQCRDSSYLAMFVISLAKAFWNKLVHMCAVIINTAHTGAYKAVPYSITALHSSYYMFID